MDYLCKYVKDLPHLVEDLIDKEYTDTRKEYNLKVVEIPDDVEWRIHDYDGAEHVYEKHRTWY